MQNFLRRIEVELNFCDKKGKIIDQQSYISTGKRDGLAISFNVSKNSVGAPNESTIVIQNMSPSNRRKIVSFISRVSVRLYANYENQPKTLLSVGDLIKAFPAREGTENSLTLTYLDGITAVLNATTERVFNPNTPLKEVVLALAEDLAEWRVVMVDVTKIEVDGFVGERGLSLSGKTSACLDNLARQYSFTWSIQNGIFQAYRDKTTGNESSRKRFSISVKDQNLLKASPELGDKFMQQIGMKINAVLNAKVIPADIIDLESTVYPEYSGTYLVHNVDFTGDTFGSDWQMEIETKQAGRFFIDKAGAPSTVVLRFIGTAGTHIPKGTTVKKIDSDILWKTDSEVEVGLDGKAFVSATSVQNGAFKFPEGTITKIETAIAGINSVTNPSPTAPGVFSKKEGN